MHFKAHLDELSRCPCISRSLTTDSCLQSHFCLHLILPAECLNKWAGEQCSVVLFRNTAEIKYNLCSRSSACCRADPAASQDSHDVLHPLFTAYRRIMPFHRNLLLQEASLRDSNRFSNSTYICRVLQSFSATLSWWKPTDWFYIHPGPGSSHADYWSSAPPLPLLCNVEGNLWK